MKELAEKYQQATESFLALAQSIPEVISAVRKSSYELIQRLTEADLQHMGEHSESGKYSVQTWLTSYTNHPADHADQIRKQLHG